MIFVERFRFVPEPETEVEVIKTPGSIKKILYHTEFEHTVTVRDSDLEKAVSAARHWLGDHYGFVRIHVMNQDEDSQPYTRKICNCHKFYKDMIAMGVLVEEHKENNHES